MAGSGRYWHSYTLMLSLPVIPFLLTIVFGGLAFAFACVLDGREIGILHAGRRGSVLGIHHLRLPFMCSDQEQAREYVLEWLSLAIPWLHVCYCGLCVKVFQTFDCLRMSDGVLVLSVAPDIRCWESPTHQWMVAVSSLALIVYVLGIPAYTLATMLYARRHDKFKDAEFLKVLGFLYTRYGTWPLMHPSPRAPAVPRQAFRTPR